MSWRRNKVETLPNVTLYVKHYHFHTYTFNINRNMLVKDFKQNVLKPKTGIHHSKLKLLSYWSSPL